MISCSTALTLSGPLSSGDVVSGTSVSSTILLLNKLCFAFDTAPTRSSWLILFKDVTTDTRRRFLLL